MPRIQLASFVFLSGILAGMISSAQADPETTTVITTPATATTPATTTVVTPSGSITTAVPEAKEVVVIPPNYKSCYTVDAGWYQEPGKNYVWVPAHKVCQYTASPTTASDQSTWVDSYWSCSQYTGGTCTNWTWVPGHWSKIAY